MKLPRTGGCRCGKVRYEITEEPQSVYTCHCLDCQRLTSSVFSLGVIVPETGFRLMGIEPRQLLRIADGGHKSWGAFTPRYVYFDLLFEGAIVPEIPLHSTFTYR